MKKLLALAAAGAIALGMAVATAEPSQAAQMNGWGGGDYGQPWKKKFNNFQGQNFGNNNWKKWDDGPKYGNNNNWKKWDGPKKHFGNWNGPKPPFHGHYPKQPPFKKFTKFPKHHHDNFVGPFIFGLALGAIVNNAYAYDYGLSPHQLWCLRNYPNTYNPATNLFYIRPGVVAVCISPYSSGYHVGYPGYPVPY